MKPNPILQLCFTLLAVSPCIFAQNATVYQEWLNNKDSNPAASRLIDYSYAGYHLGKSLPLRVEGPVFKVTDYGAIPDDGKDDIDAVQSAVDAACVNGGGVVSFPAGNFDFDVNYPKANPVVRIWASNVVVRGAGNSPKGTVVYDHKQNDGGDWTTVKLPNFFIFSSVDMHTANEVWYPNSEWDRTPPITTISPAPRLSNVLTVADASKLKVGETYVVTEADPDLSLVKAMSPGSPSYGDRPSATGTDYKAMKYRQIVDITAIAGNQITIDSPLGMELQARWSPTLWATEHPVIREVGLEDLYLKMDLPQPFIHHDGAAADYGKGHVRFDWVENGWVHNVTSEGTTSAVYLRDTKNCVVYDCAVTGGEGHFGYQVSDTPSRNLFLNVDGHDQFHTFSVEGGVGNVFKNCVAGDTAAVDLHGNVWGLYSLFDNLTGCVGAGGGAGKQVPPNHGIGFTVWNWQMGNNSPYSRKPQDVFVDVTAYNAYNAPGFIAAGVRSKDGHPVYYTDLEKKRQTADLNEIWGYAEKINSGPVQPASLYDAQSAERLTFGWCELITPTAGVCFAPESPITLQADAKAKRGRKVAKVEFLEGGKPIGSATAAPYTFAWKLKGMGVYQFSTRMTDDKGEAITSAVTPVTAGRIEKIEDNDSAIHYSGDVPVDTEFKYSGGTARWFRINAKAEYTFKGTKFSVFTAGIGYCQIYVDDMNTPVKEWNAALPVPVNYRIYDSGILQDGVHTVRIANNNRGFALDYLMVTKTGETDSKPAPAQPH